VRAPSVVFVLHGPPQALDLHAYATPREVTIALSRYFLFYNERRLHQNLAYRTPDELYFATGKVKKAA
jgi:putative transposase